MKVIFPAHVYKKFLVVALKYADPTQSRSTWREIIGVLIGRFHDDAYVEITDVAPLNAGTSVYVEVTDYTQLLSVVPFERIEAGEYIVGWIHTHPGLGLFLSGTDINTQKRYQSWDPRAIAIVVDPTKITHDHPGFRVLRVQESASSWSFSEPYYDLDFEIPGVQDYREIYQQALEELHIELIPPKAIAPSEYKISTPYLDLFFELIPATHQQAFVFRCFAFWKRKNRHYDLFVEYDLETRVSSRQERAIHYSQHLRFLPGLTRKKGKALIFYKTFSLSHPSTSVSIPQIRIRNLALKLIQPSDAFKEVKVITLSAK